MQFKILEKYFPFELHASETQDCFVQASHQLVFKKIHIQKQFQVEEVEAKKKKVKYII